MQEQIAGPFLRLPDTLGDNVSILDTAHQLIDFGISILYNGCANIIPSRISLTAGNSQRAVTIWLSNKPVSSDRWLVFVNWDTHVGKFAH